MNREQRIKQLEEKVDEMINNLSKTVQKEVKEELQRMRIEMHKQWVYYTSEAVSRDKRKAATESFYQGTEFTPGDKCPHDEQNCGLIDKPCVACFRNPSAFKKDDWLVNDNAGELPRPFKFIDIGEGINKQQMVIGVTTDNKFVYYPLLSCKKWEPRKGEKVIANPEGRKGAFIGIYDRPAYSENYHLVSGRTMANIIPFISIEQYDKIIKGE